MVIAKMKRRPMFVIHTEQHLYQVLGNTEQNTPTQREFVVRYG